MRFPCATLVLASFLTSLLVTNCLAQEKPEGPTDAKARKTYEKALKYLHERNTQAAFDEFKKADKQDGGHCLDCQMKMMRYGVEFAEWKTAELAAEEMLAEAKGDKETAIAHYQFAVVLVDEGLQRLKAELFTRAHEEITNALAAVANFPDAVWLDGTALAHMGQDDSARSRFEQYVKMRPGDDPKRLRALRYITRPELVRAKIAPPFAITTTEGQRISMDGLQGKVVLLDFWATWCEPCREALPTFGTSPRSFRASHW